MYLQINDKSYLELAEKIADATITTQLVTDEGILREMKPEIDDSNDGVQFKGIFIRHLAFLYEVTKNPAYKDFILKMRNPSSQKIMIHIQKLRLLLVRPFPQGKLGSKRLRFGMRDRGL